MRTPRGRTGRENPILKRSPLLAVVIIFTRLRISFLHDSIFSILGAFVQYFVGEQMIGQANQSPALPEYTFLNSEPTGFDLGWRDAGT